MESEISPADLQALLAAAHPPICLLDVRGADEFAFCCLAGAINIPLVDLPARLVEIPAGHTIVTLCHHGVRSARAAEFLRQNGYNEVRSMAGGVDAWACQVDPALPRY